MSVPRSSPKRVAVITGASSGLGAEFSRQVDSRLEFGIDEIWLVARRSGPMSVLASQFKRVRGVVVPLDLAADGSATELARRLEGESAEVVLLVNNAGLGKSGAFEALGVDDQLRMIDVNVRVLTELTHRLLPRMRSGSAVIHVASSIAFAPAPNFCVYAATKAYVLSFSEALEFELRPRGIRTLAVCPGPVRTEFFEVAGGSDTVPGKESSQASSLSRVMAEPDSVVARALDDLARGRTISIYGYWIRCFTRLARFAPRELLLRVIAGRRA